MIRMNDERTLDLKEEKLMGKSEFWMAKEPSSGKELGQGQTTTCHKGFY